MSKKRKRYTEQERARILAAVDRKGLTYAQAARTFGVSEVTIWKWRKVAKTAPWERNRQHAQAVGSLAGFVRAEVRARMRQVLPGIVREETAAYARRVFSSPSLSSQRKRV